MITDLWYKNAVFYCLSVSTYMDANGDGVGDFAGLMRRLDYLHGLGVTAIWLMPFQTSPCRDDGYDISNYYEVDPRYGTLGDFVEFTHAAQERGIRVIIDLVVNHTSNEHSWFKEARRDPKSKYRDWYVWSKKKPRSANQGMVFPGVQKSTWSYDSVARAWYFHRFYDFQPDLNTANLHVQAEILKIMGFWIQLGVCGFRMDAVPFVIATKGPQVTKPTEQFDMLRRLREFLQWRDGDSIILAEANVLPETDLDYFGDDGALPGTPVLRYGDELGMGDDLRLPERQCARTPMQWSTEPQAGFTKSDKPILPVISNGPFGYEHVNAAQQRRDPNSMLNWTERIIRMRKEVPEVGWGDFQMIQTRDPAVLAIRYDWRNNSVLTIHNLAGSPREVSFDVGVTDEAGSLLVNLLSEDHSRAGPDGKHSLMLEGYAYRWYRVGGLDYLLRRSDIDFNEYGGRKQHGRKKGGEKGA